MNWAKQKEREQLDIYSIPKDVRKKHPGKTSAEITRDNKLSKLPYVVTVPNPDKIKKYVPPPIQTPFQVFTFPKSFKRGISSNALQVMMKTFYNNITILKPRLAIPSPTLMKWCNENCISKFMFWEDDKWKFELEEDAAHFKMVWG